MLAADGVVVLPLASCKPQVGDRPPLIGAGRAQVGAHFQSLVAAILRYRRSPGSLRSSPATSNVSPEGPRPEQGAQMVPGGAQPGVLLANVILELQGRQPRPRQLDLRQVAGPDPFFVDVDDVVEGFRLSCANARLSFAS